MANYERQFREDPAACGEPSAAIVELLQSFPAPSSVLDLGCGQGRDALVAARAGHSVTAVDRSPTGVAQMMGAAESEGLALSGVVADLLDYAPSARYDVVLLDRVLHQFRESAQRAEVFALAASATRPGGTLVIADTPSNRDEIDELFARQGPDRWSIEFVTKDLRFAVRSV